MTAGAHDANDGGVFSGAYASTLEAALRHANRRAPHAAAIADPPDRETFTDGPPRVLAYAQAEHATSAIAHRLRALGLQTGAVVALQMPNIAEGVLTCLGIMRAGMIPAVLPLAWRRRDIAAALEPTGAKAIITCARVGDVDHMAIAMQAAADIFSIRYVCAFGAAWADDVVGLDDMLLADAPVGTDTAASAVKSSATAAITFDVTAEGARAVAHSHRALMAGAQALPDTAAPTHTPVLLSGLPLSSFAGLSLTLAHWITGGGTLLLHQPFDAEVFARQLRDCPCTEVIVPGPLLARFADAELFAPARALRRIVSLWRAPHQAIRGARWPHAVPQVVDVLCFGESGHIAQPRDAFGRVRPLAQTQDIALSTPSAVVLTPAGTLGLRGAMVPRQRTDHALPALDWHADPPLSDVVDTGYPCQLDQQSGLFELTGAPHGIVSVGGTRMLLRDLNDIVRQVDPHAVIVPAADTLLGQRLSGRSADQTAMRRALETMGAHPLVAAAFPAGSDDGGTAQSQAFAASR